ncbi:CHASE2 domain-containing protein [Oceanibacterium hippocampi]|nr:adenylate/guanylate cyclase domain-containing protein [Oceanibacterium hippocampi]
MIWRRWQHYLVPAIMLALALGVRLDQPQLLVTLQNRIFDTYQQIKPRSYEPVPVRIVDIDDESLNALGQWPWPRKQVADLVVRLFNAGAATVVFDIVFAEPDRTSPREIVKLWPELPAFQALKDDLSGLPDNDELLAEIIAQAPVVTGFALVDGNVNRYPLGTPEKWGVAIAGDDPKAFLPSYRGAQPSLEVLEKAASGNGSFNMVPDRDNLVRRVPTFVRIEDRLYPSLVLEALRVAQGASTYILKGSGANLEESFGEHTGLNHVKVGRLEIPTDANGQMWVHYTRPVPERSVPVWKFYAEELGRPDETFDPALIEGNIIFIGTSAAGLKDLRATPLAAALPGTEVHAQATEQILLDDFLERPDWADGAELLFILLLGIALIVALPYLGAAWCAVIGAAGAAGGIFFSWQMYDLARLLVDPVVPALSVLLVYLASSLLNFLRSEREKRQVRGAFSQYLSPALVEQLARQPERLRLGGETKEMTFLFCDVRGFTAISERFKGNPQGLTFLINRLLTPLTAQILQREGTIDKYMGDCIMAFWNAPLDDAEHARHACVSALAMMEAMRVLNAEREEEAKAEQVPFLPLNVGIGLNTGACVVGNMGSDQRFDYSVLGDAVNLASRLEGQSKNYGVDIVVGDSTRQQASDFAVLELDRIAVKGKSEAETIHCLLGDSGLAESDAFRAHAERHEVLLPTYRSQQWADARRLLDECRKLDAACTGKLAALYDMYEARIDDYEKNPPPADWDGVYVATSK